MKATITYEVLHFFEVMYFEDLLIFECLLLEMHSKYKKEKSIEKQTKVIKMIYVDGKGTVFPEKLKLEGESFE